MNHILEEPLDTIEQALEAAAAADEATTPKVLSMDIVTIATLFAPLLLLLVLAVLTFCLVRLRRRRYRP